MSWFEVMEKADRVVCDPKSSDVDVERAIAEVDALHNPEASGAIRRTAEMRSPEHGRLPKGGKAGKAVGNGVGNGTGKLTRAHLDALKGEE